MNASEFPLVLFSTETGDIRVNAVLRDRTLRLTQKAMAGLFGVKSQAITRQWYSIESDFDRQIKLLLDANDDEKSSQ